MHRLIREDEKVEVFSAFAGQHGTHLISTEIREGAWSLFMHCPLCHDWQTFQIDNEARRASLALKCQDNLERAEAS